MASEKGDFSLSGPSHLTCIDWTNANHRTSVLACLVEGVYVMERDRQEKREGSRALAPLWWEFFHFELLDRLVDAADLSIFGAIYEYKPPTSHYNDSIEPRPHYVIAFRGTLFKLDTIVRDIQLDVRVIRNKLRRTSRFENGMQAVRNMVAVGASKVWLAGHSLGATMAMLAGKTMAKRGIFLELFLFNPPFVSAPIERIKNKFLKGGVRITHSAIKAVLALALEAKNQNQRNVSGDPVAALSAWLPCLFVNPADHICSEYVGYFEHRKKMEEIGAGHIEKLATQHSLGGLLMSAVGKGSEAEEPFHLIPSANLTVNQTPTEDCKNAHGIHQWWRHCKNAHAIHQLWRHFKNAHGIHQWWRPDLDLHSKPYRYQ